jgi:sec-independent protein translocase protein TatB
MEILGIGASELVFIIIIALIVLGPKDMQKAGKTIGRWLNRLVRSDGWKAFQQTSRELRNLPTTLMREANMDLQETEQEIHNAINPRFKPPASSRSRNPPPSNRPENSIRPPSVNPTESDDTQTSQDSAENKT